MLAFAELTEKVEPLSKDEPEELKHGVELCRIELRRREIFEAAEEARKEHVEGKTVVLSFPEKIIDYF